MITELKGYHIQDSLHVGTSTAIYRGQGQDGRQVIIKLLGAAHPSLEDISQLRNEYEIGKILEIEGIVNPLELLNYGHGLALILEDIGGESLKKYVQGRTLGIGEFLEIAIKLATALGDIHSRRVIHKDIKLENIIINPKTRQVKIADFSIASRLEEEKSSYINPNQMEGTLAYMSPEQTGRMNRFIDYRSDYYSLGVSFYEILTGRLPFIAEDPLELVHSHIAKNPPSLRAINPEIPAAIEAIVMKLMAKTAEERYQSAVGLKLDLETCYQKWVGEEREFELVPGQGDRAGQLLIPQQLYGRQKEVALLMATFNRVSNGASEIMLVSGYSGIGKTSLVNEVHKPIVKSRGYFIAGKFDQYKRNIPYSALIQAFGELIQQLLAESEAAIQNWQEKIAAVVGENGRVITDVIPEVEFIIGPQPEIPQLGPTESQNRFNRVFQKFVGVFTAQEHPLVVFLDDLQWADTASLKLIELLVTAPESKYLLLIGAYRDNEVSPTHPLIQTLGKIQDQGGTVENVLLGPLQLEHAQELIADTVPPSNHNQNSGWSEKIAAFAELLFNKTQGNPFFLTQLLKTLYQEKLVQYNFQAGEWQWDISEIQAVGITDYNVVELIARNMQKLAAATQEVLKLGACLGNQFNLETLAIVHEKSASATAADLWEALQAGLILPLSNAYKIPMLVGEHGTSRQLSDNSRTIAYRFLHDRVQQAAYTLIPEAEKKSTHLHIGQLLLQNTNPDEREENIFALVNQLNYGIDIITATEEKTQLAQLNLIAGKKAKAAAAYEAAVRYFNVGLALLSPDSWVSDYDLTLELYTKAAEAEYCNANFEGAQQQAEVILAKATSDLDRVKVYELKMEMFTAQHQILAAIDTGMQALQMLGVSLQQGMQLHKLPSLDELDNCPEMTDPDKLATMRVLMNLLSPVMMAKPEILLQVILTQVNLCLESGHSAIAALSYSWYGMLLCGSLGQIELGYHAGQLALKLLDKFNATSLKCRSYNMIYAFITPWKSHIKENLQPLQEGMQSGLETGDLMYASYCILNYCTYLFVVENRLASALEKQTAYINLLLQLKNDISTYTTKIWMQANLNLQGVNHHQTDLIGDMFDETAILPNLEAANDGWSLFSLYLAKGILCCTFKDVAGAIANTFKSREYVASVGGFPHAATQKFYHSLAMLAHYHAAEPSQQEEYLQLVAANQEQMKIWAYHAPMNFQHMYDLVEAEKARILGEYVQAIELYDKAIAGARDNGYIHYEALATEKAGEFYLAWGREKIAKTYITDAYYCYAKWGAAAKVQDLEAEYPYLIPIATPTPSIDIHKTTHTTAGTATVLDLSTALKAGQAISGEIELEKLLAKLMQILIENAGAQTGSLFLMDQGSLGLAAVGATDKTPTVYWPLLTLDASLDLPTTVINYVRRTRIPLVLNHASSEGMFAEDPYIRSHQVKSLLCSPIVKGGKLVGILYLENNLAIGAFTPARLELLRLLSSQAAISLELARSVSEVQSTLAYLKAIINNIADGLVVTDAAGNITQHNPALVKMFGLSSPTITGGKCSEVVSPQIGELLYQTSQNPQEVLSAEVELVQGRIGAAVATAIMPEAGEGTLGSVTIIRDITAEKEIDRMKTDFISTVSHELRTPLTSVVGFAKIIHKKLTDKVMPAFTEGDKKTRKALEQVGDNIQIIISEGERLTALINDVLDIAKMEAGKIEWHFQPVVAGELIERAAAATSSLRDAAGLQLHLEIAPDLPEIEADKDRMLQVLINLISNAVKFTPAGSITLKAFQTTGEIIFSVIDTGVGIAPDDQEKVFEKFKQVGDTMTDKPKGTGLGLPICKQIVEHHGGRIWVESDRGKGSNFSFAIPIKGATIGAGGTFNIDTLVQQLRQSISPTPEAAATTTAKTILVVDDEVNIRSLLRQELESQGYIVREAANGMDAITQVKAEKPDLIILDVMMPAINGFDVAAVLRNDPTTMNIPIIILSIVQDQSRGYRLGIDRYLTKPINTETLLSDIELLLSQGGSKKKVLVVDEDVNAVKTLVEVLEAKGYAVVEAVDGPECIQKAIEMQPDLIILDSVLSRQYDIVKTLRFEKGLENLFFVLLS
ncbi:AAA family ATPase [[Phormidium] sp. ETS-05]|uniref:AAA family ATPase n=1 Tax=[Phormidium] sp. ETS-05 TaxID=222819 RepID=UPI0018EEFC2B|nr:AAA family ATPase [[Phormidium] sp. ETS-05]